MSKVDVLMPQERLSSGKSPERRSAIRLDVVPTEEPSGDEFPNESDKQLAEVIFACKRAGSEELTFETEGDHQQQVRARKKHRRGKKRKWRPYSKLTWDERKEVEERDSRRAFRVRAEMCAYGHTLAPYNTTQFLMEDHNLQEPDYEHIPVSHRHRENSNSMDSSDEFYSSPEDEDDFLEKNFAEAYEDIHAERLNSMSKGELVQELMILEDRTESLEKKLEEARQKKETLDAEAQTSNEETEQQLEKIRVFREEIKKLSEENNRLKRENEQLRLHIPACIDS